MRRAMTNATPDSSLKIKRVFILIIHDPLFFLFSLQRGSFWNDIRPSGSQEVLASNLKLAPWNRELGSIGRVVDE
jgi:hypothetical protein